MLNDLAYAVRMLLKRPGFTLVALLTLGIGLTANTTIFTFVNSFLLKPFPFPADEELVAIGRPNAGHEELGSLSYPDLVTLRERCRSLASVAGYSWSHFNLATQERPVWSGGAKVSADFFRTLGVEPLSGRDFQAADDLPGADPTVLLSESLWETQYGKAADVIGSEILVDGQQRTVIGIIPRGHELPIEARVWVPLNLAYDETDRNRTWLSGLGRITRDGSVRQTQAELATLPNQLQNSTTQPTGYRAIRLRDEQMGPNAKMMFYLLLGAVGLLLLIVCTNVANLQLSRAVARAPELAIRSAIGASRTRLVRQLLLESLVLAVVAAGIGLLLSRFGIDLLRTQLPGGAMAWFDFGVDYRVLVFTASIALVTTLFFGLAPALRMTGNQHSRCMTSSGTRSSIGARPQRIQNTLVVLEMAFALGLLAAGSVMVRGLVHLAEESPGFSEENVLTGSLALAESAFPEAADRSQFATRLLSAIETVPGVASVGLVSEFPLSGSSLYRTYSVEGQTDTSYLDNPDAIYKATSPNYFESMQIALIEGRTFAPSDAAGAPLVAVINAPLARRLWPQESPVGQRMKFDLPSGSSPWVEIVGVVAGTKHEKINRPAPPQIYVSYPQAPSRRISLAIKTAIPPAGVLSAVEDQLHSLAPGQALFRAMPMSTYMGEVFSPLRLATNLFWIFGAIALGLAAIGIYGVMMFSVQQRRHEIGIRMALGAVPQSILRLVVRTGFRLGLIGVGLGLLLATGMTLALGSAMLGTNRLDVVSLCYAAVILLTACLLACLLPGLRAAAADPLSVLRDS